MVVDEKVAGPDASVNRVALVQHCQPLRKVADVLHNRLVARLDRVRNDTGLQVSDKALLEHHVDCLVSERVLAPLVPV